jgi:hypothetical protein
MVAVYRAIPFNKLANERPSWSSERERKTKF